MRFGRWLGWLALMGAGVATGWAEVRLPAVIGDQMVLQQGEPVRIWGWATEGERVRVRLAGQERVTYAWDNAWQVTFAPLAASAEPLEMVVDGFNRIVLGDILVGEVWLASGQSNMRLTVAGSSHAEASKALANDPRLRLFQVGEACADHPQPDVDGRWEVATPATVADFSAVAFHFGREILDTQGVPVGIILPTVGGTRAVNWTSAPVLARNPDARGHYDHYRELLRAYPDALDAWRAEVAGGHPEAPRPRSPDRRRPAGYFNAMIHGLIPYTLRGVIWYQGETDTWNAEEYARMFPDLIDDWRDRWGQGALPFLYVQLPGFNGKPGVDENYPFLREIQRRIEPTRPNLAMAVTIDQGEADDIHPREKRAVAHRLALLARHRVYGEDVVDSGPRPSAIAFEGAVATVRFDSVAGGLVRRGNALEGFALAGEDGVFQPAEARIEGGDTVVVTAAAVAAPRYLRYAFEGFPPCTLYNSAGLPAVPFRTDDFPRGEGAVTEVPDPR